MILWELWLLWSCLSYSYIILRGQNFDSLQKPIPSSCFHTNYSSHFRYIANSPLQAEMWWKITMVNENLWQYFAYTLLSYFILQSTLYYRKIWKLVISNKKIKTPCSHLEILLIFWHESFQMFLLYINIHTSTCLQIRKLYSIHTVLQPSIHA